MDKCHRHNTVNQNSLTRAISIIDLRPAIPLLVNGLLNYFPAPYPSVTANPAKITNIILRKALDLSPFLIG